jgi:DNA processing protein
MQDDDLRAWTILARTPGIDADALTGALAVCGSPAALLRAAAGSGELPRLSAVARAFLASPAAAPRAVDLRWLEAERHHLVACTDPRYPALLRQYAGCPVVLFAAGSVAALAEPQLAVVGSRNPTHQGRETAFAFSAYLGERGLGITSGLAEGVDACAHRGALKSGGITLGVLGNGMDIVYPRCNQGLFREIRETGALLSEFPLGTPPRRANFPQRNRIIAGIALGTLVVEATERSGSLITARLANQAGRAVFAIPGSIHNPLSRGCHDLIKDGATLVDGPVDIMRQLNFSAFFVNDFHAAGAAPEGPRPASGMDKDHKILLDALGFDPVDLDTLVVRTGFKPDAVSSMMLILELEGHVQAAPGGRYSRVAYRRAGGER